MKKLLGILVLGLLWCNVALTESSLPKCKGSDKSKWMNCYGEYLNLKIAPGITADFKGEFGNIPGVREGQGFGIAYKDGKFHQSFKGEYKNNIGFRGTSEYFNGFKFNGEYKEGFPSFGELIYPGEWKNSRYVYFGEFEGHQNPSGFGSMGNLSGDIIYLGEVKNGKNHGLGYAYIDNLKVFAAVFENDNIIKQVSEQQLKILKEKEKKFLDRKLNFEVYDKVASECKVLGFFLGTKDYADCNLKLYVLYKEEAIEEQKIKAAEEMARAAEAQAKAAEANARANQSIADIERSRDSQKMINQGLKSLSGQCNLMLGNC